MHFKCVLYFRTIKSILYCKVYLGGNRPNVFQFERSRNGGYTRFPRFPPRETFFRGGKLIFRCEKLIFRGGERPFRGGKRLFRSGNMFSAAETRFPREKHLNYCGQLLKIFKNNEQHIKSRFYEFPLDVPRIPATFLQ